MSSTKDVSNTKEAPSFTKYDDVGSRYWFDSEELSRLRDKAPWKDDPIWFQSVAVSPSAILKMVRVLAINILLYLVVFSWTVATIFFILIE